MEKGQWKGYKNGKVFQVSQLTEFLENAIDNCNIESVHSGRHVELLNVPCSFDIETSSFMMEVGQRCEDKKFACMYIWQFGLNGSVIYGRTWAEFGDLLESLVDYLGLDHNHRLVIYVHNLAYEFQFIRKYFEWDKVFTIKKRRPVQAICDGFEFRCSYFLSNYSLAYLGDNLLHTYPVKKLVGDLDYSLIRHSKTPLTDKELEYCFNDVRVVMSYIQEKIEQDGDISKIPLTNTGYVRNYCRKECFFEDKESEEDKKRTLFNYRSIMKSLTITDKNEYDQLKRAFMGGFTHASCLYSNAKSPIANVGSADLTSSYPFAMCAQYFPMSKGDYIGHVDNPQLFKYYLSKYCCVFDIEIENLQPIVEFENIISLSRCVTYGKVVTNNGRIVSAQKLRTTLTELDYDTITKFYTWTSCKIMNLRVYERGYLPKALIMAILNLYEDKTTLKGVYGKEVEYLVSKNMINASFGMMVTDIIRAESEYINDQWFYPEGDVVSQLNSYNKNFNRFLYYGWGVWVTAHARHNLFSAIYEFKEDYVYSDTDSIKGVNFEKHMDYFKRYNQKVLEQLLNMCNHYGISFSKCKPKTQKGEEKLLGVWEIEEGYKLFKTVGAKRYIYTYPDGFVNMTTAGINKKEAMPYLIAKWNQISFDSEEFSNIKKAYAGDYEMHKWVIEQNYSYDGIFAEYGDGLYIPSGHTGKLTMTYIDGATSGVVTDYLGETSTFNELSSVHMEPQSYYMSMVGDYLKFLEGVQYVEY